MEEVKGGYQFIHVETYARVGAKKTKSAEKKRSAAEILAEQWRDEGACPHIENPRNPGLLYGVKPSEVLTLMNEWADQAKDAQGRKLRKDGHCILIGVASLPRVMEDEFPQFAEDTLEWLKAKYGDRLKSVVVHDDEAHPHLHFSVIPRMGEKFEDIHDGFKASKQANAEGKKKGEQNLAYITAMRELQDDFGRGVAMKHGLTRLGPGKRRLTRAQWNAEQVQQRFFSDAKAQHRAVREKAYKVGLAKAEKKSKAIIEGAQKKSKSFGGKVASMVAGALGGWHKPTAKAKEEAERANARAEDEKKKAQEAQQKAQKEADRRVAAAGTQITIEKARSAELKKELEKSEEKTRDMFVLINWYERKFGKAPDNLPKIK